MFHHHANTNPPEKEIGPFDNFQPLAVDRGLIRFVPFSHAQIVEDGTVLLFHWVGPAEAELCPGLRSELLGFDQTFGIDDCRANREDGILHYVIRVRFHGADPMKGKSCLEALGERLRWLSARPIAGTQFLG